MNVHFQGEPQFVRKVKVVLHLITVVIILVIGNCAVFFLQNARGDPQNVSATSELHEKKAEREIWLAPDSTLIPTTPEGDLIRYGKDLISHTARYLGPQGKVRPISNGMNCQNCHLRAGTKPFGNNYAAVASTYPRFRARSGMIESMEKRINDCIERSLNGQKLDDNSQEMRAIIAYFKWLGKDVNKQEVPLGSGITALPFLTRAADAVAGKRVYLKHCALCHGGDAAGYKHPDSLEWKYPPLAGANSYNVGAGLYRLSRFAGYVKSNMPHGTYYTNPVLSDEEAWDVAAFVNSLPRPMKLFSRDWPDLSDKPVDHPFGPYADTFPESQHKYGPFGPIQAARTRK